MLTGENIGPQQYKISDANIRLLDAGIQLVVHLLVSFPRLQLASGALLQGSLCTAAVAAEAHFPPISPVMDGPGNGPWRKHFNKMSFSCSQSPRGIFKCAAVCRYSSIVLNRLIMSFGTERLLLQCCFLRFAVSESKQGSIEILLLQLLTILSQYSLPVSL